MLSRHPLPTTRPSAPTRRHQTRHWHLPLLPHPRWPRRHCCRPPPHRTHHHSCSRLTNLLTKCKHSVRKGLKSRCARCPFCKSCASCVGAACAFHQKDTVSRGEQTVSQSA